MTKSVGAAGTWWSGCSGQLSSLHHSIASIASTMYTPPSPRTLKQMTRRPAHMIGHLNIINFSIFMFPPKIKLLKQNLSVNSHTPQIFRSNWSFWRGINSDLFSPVTVGLNILSKSAIKWKTYENYISCFFFTWFSNLSFSALLSAQSEYRALCRSTEELPVRL